MNRKVRKIHLAAVGYGDCEVHCLPRLIPVPVGFDANSQARLNRRKYDHIHRDSGAVADRYGVFFLFSVGAADRNRVRYLKLVVVQGNDILTVDSLGTTHRQRYGLAEPAQSVFY